MTTDIKVSRMNEILNNAYALTQHAISRASEASSKEEVLLSLHELKLAAEATNLCKNFKDLIFENEDRIEGLDKKEIDTFIILLCTTQKFAGSDLMKRV